MGKDNKKLTTEEFIKRAKVVHGDIYLYDAVDYDGAKSKVNIKCKVHGIFKQASTNHLRGQGCPKCSFEKLHQLHKATKNEFISTATETHGCKYDYSKVEYKNARTKVTIICKEHGEFQITPGHHLEGSGCSECANYGFNKLEPAMLYYIEYNGFYKIGITNRNVELRYPNLKDKLKVIQTWRFKSGIKALKEEQKIVSEHKKLVYMDLNPITNTISREVFNQDILKLKNE